MKIVCFTATFFVFFLICGSLEESEFNSVGDEEEHPETSELNNQVCTPNETKMQDCNRCRCAANGIGWFCTRRNCPSAPVKIPVNEPGFTCTPNQSFKDDCNTCSCDSSGTLARCTAMACDPNERSKRSTNLENLESSSVLSSSSPKDKKEKKDSHGIKTGPVFRKGANSDTFREPLSHPYNTQQNREEKVPLTSSHRLTSTTATETNNYDPKPKDYGSTSGSTFTEDDLNNPDFKCKPSESFKLDCNTCWCNAAGNGPRYCTRIACKPKTYPPLNPV